MPNLGSRIVRLIAFPEPGWANTIAATLAEAARQGLRDLPEATVSIVFAYGPGDDIDSIPTRGRSSVSRDGQGLDPGSDNLIIGPDDGQVQVEVVTELYEGFPGENEVFNLPPG